MSFDGRVPAETSLPDDAQVFPFTRMSRTVALYFTVAFAILLALSLPFMVAALRTHDEVLGTCALSISLLWVLGLFWSGVSLRRAGRAIAVNESGIWYISSRESPVFFNWHEVVAVQPNPWEYLFLADGTGRKIHIPTIPNFAAALEYILKHTAPPENDFPDGQVFICRRWPIHIVGMISALFVFLAAWCLWWEELGFSVVPVAFLASAALIWLIALTIPSRIILTAESIQICYPLRRKIIPFQNVSAVSLKDVGDEGTVLAVIIERETGGKITMPEVEALDPIKLYHSLKLALKRARPDKNIG